MNAGEQSQDVAAVLADMKDCFGDLHTNGVTAILAHPDLPEHFGRKLWTDWTFRPAEAAFDWAHDRGLIVPWKLSGKWTFTPLGLAVRAHLEQQEQRHG